MTVQLSHFAPNEDVKRTSRELAEAALEIAAGRPESKPAAIGVTTFGRQGVTQRTVAIGGTAEELNTRRGQ
jgi:hypothetical protein